MGRAISNTSPHARHHRGAFGRAHATRRPRARGPRGDWDCVGTQHPPRHRRRGARVKDRVPLPARGR
ncbi:MAG TPA: hypothetical protein DCR70_01960 [Phycisphaerales bacterium]|nr:hypothetical protein [Phycisphaerales bacterium]